MSNTTFREDKRDRGDATPGPGISNRESASDEAVERQAHPPVDARPSPEDAAGRVGDASGDDLGGQTSHKAGSRSIAQKEAGSRYPDRSMPASRKVDGAFGKEPTAADTTKDVEAEPARDAREAAGSVHDIPRGPEQPPYGSQVERLIGHGTILHDGQPVGETDYDITVTPPHLRGTGLPFEAGLPGTEPANVPDVTGRLLGPLYQAEPYAEDVHTLVLNDGRLLDFRVIQPDTNEIVGVSWFRMP
jgi:hypothetical protein